MAAFLPGGAQIMLSAEPLATGATEFDGPLAYAAECAEATRCPPCLWYGARHRLSRHCGWVYQFIGYLGMGQRPEPRTIGDPKGRYIPPSESAIRRTLQRSQAEELDSLWNSGWRSKAIRWTPGTRATGASSAVGSGPASPSTISATFLMFNKCFLWSARRSS